MDQGAAFVSGLGDTIVAVSTPRGGGGRGVVRLSGDDALALVCRAGDVADALAATRFGVVDGRYLLADGTPVPAAFWIMRGPRSYTAEDVVEIHTVGSDTVLELVVEDLRQRGARVARPGEFTRRAYLNGRIDLTRAEAVAALIHARTEAERRAAVAVLDGEVSRTIEDLSDALMRVLTPMELDLDFSDQDIDIIDHSAAAQQIRSIATRVARLLAERASVVRRDGPRRVLLSGPANAGKSSLFNALVGADAAIVSDRAGTTRDFLEAEVALDGLDVVLVDTAGDDFEGGAVDAAAHGLRAREAERADLVVSVRNGLDAKSGVGATGDVLVLTRADLLDAGERDGLVVSSKTGEGLEHLRAAIAERLCLEKEAPHSSVHLQQRHRGCYQRVHEALERAAEAADSGFGAELVAADLREALTALAEITGADHVDGVLDRVFRDFCIGK